MNSAGDVVTALTNMDDGHAMTKGVIPVRHSSLAGLIKLPRRYENAVLNNPGNSKLRKNNVCENPVPGREAVCDRLEDLMAATMWVKQELILLRQHDILLKRQFFNIHHSIQALQSNSSQVPTSSSTSTPATSATTTNCDIMEHLSTSSTSTSRLNSDSLIFQSSNTYSSIHMDTLLVRPSLSFKLLSTVDDNSDESDDGNDVFFERQYYRPRTSSMRTSRDLAAVARRRGSKDLI